MQYTDERMSLRISLPDILENDDPSKKVKIGQLSDTFR